MGAAVRAFDWSATPLGPIDRWPQSLRTAVNICLDSRFPMFVWWGPDLINVYNDAYVPILGTRHPAALGRPARAIWGEVWGVVGPQIEAVTARGEASWHERVKLVVERSGFPEDAYFTWSHSPVRDEAGGVGGVLCVVTEETATVLAGRERDRLAAQRQLALDAAALGWWHYDPVTRVATYDRRYTEVFGVTGHQRPNDEILKRLHPDDLPGVWAKVEAALDPRDPRPYSAQYRVVRDDGSVRWVEAHGTATFEGDGDARRATSLVGTVADVTDRRRAEDQARTILESITDAFFALDREWRFSYVNPQAERVLGRTPGDLLGRVIWEVYPGLHGSEFERVYRRVVAEQVALSVTPYYPDHDRWYEVHAYPASDGGVSVYFRNATDRVRAEEQLRRSHDTFYHLIQNDPFGVYVVDADFRLREASLGSRKVFANVSPLLGRDFEEVLRAVWPEPFATEAIGRFRHTLATGEPYAAPSTVQQRQGAAGVEAYDWRIERVALPDGRPGVVCYFYDMTEFRRAEAARRASEDRLRLTADAIPALIAYVDRDGRYEFVNAAYRDWFGVGPEQVVGRAVREVVGDAAYAERLPQIERALAGETVRFEYPMRHDALGPRDTETTYVPDFADDGRTVRGFVVLVYDVSDRTAAERERERLLAGERAARAEAERAGRMKDEFLATLSHELRTPLNAILGWSQVVRRNPADAAGLAEGLAVIERNARTQAQIIEDLLDMSRIVSGKVRLDVQRIDLAAAVRAAVETVKPAADAKAVRLQVVLDPHAGPVSGDANRLQQVFWNLLSNAVKFTPRGGRVQVLLERVNSHIEVAVVDTGEGISPEFLPHVFDRFRQQDGSTTRRHGGLGLGLAIVKQLVELHGGTVRAKSAGAGQGSTFTVDLPLTVVHPEEPPAAERRHPRRGTGAASDVPDLCALLAGVRVLVVDDEPDARALVKRVLEDCGAVVTAVGSAAEAVPRVAADRPDVLVSDIGMPDEDGYALIRRVRALGPESHGDVPALALTAYARSEDRVRAVYAGFQSHVPKPVEPDELVMMVAGLAGRTGSAARHRND
jgi:PAS domain S-box-containing protein